MSESVDYRTLEDLNPHLPPEPEEVVNPERPEEEVSWDDDMPKNEKVKLRKQYQAALVRRKVYEKARKLWLESTEFMDAPKKLIETVHDLERRGLLQYDEGAKRYDLHPVVRGVAAGKMTLQDKEHYGLRLVDHFAGQPHKLFHEVETLEDLRPALLVVQTLLKLRRLKEAAKAFRHTVAEPLLFNLEAYTETVTLLHPFFPTGWGCMPAMLDEPDSHLLMGWAATTLDRCGEMQAGYEVQNALTPGGNTSFTTTFTPAAGASGNRTAALQITSNDPDENPFDISLEGFSYSTTLDVDADGMNDWGEYKLSALGFDWQVANTALVAALYANASAAGLYTAQQVGDLNVGTPLLLRNPANGEFTLTLGVEKSTALPSFQPFPMTAPQTLINGQGKLEFRFTVPENAAFFRLRAE